MAAQRDYRAENPAARREWQAKQRAQAARKRPPRLTKPLDEVIRAGRLIADGAPYAEVARTVGWDVATVARHFPGRGWDRAEVVAHARLHHTA
jgi:DNA invertase Pin-like site-specific DNA recombinase